MNEIKFELNPFRVPNFVTIKMPPRPRQEGVSESPSLSLSEVESDVLAELCDEFRRGVFEKAGKIDPAEGGTDHD